MTTTAGLLAMRRRFRRLALGCVAGALIAATMGCRSGGGAGDDTQEAQTPSPSADPGRDRDPNDTMTTDTVNDFKAALLVEPDSLSMSDVADFHVGIAVTNLGSETRDPKIFDARLLVDGERSYAWELAIQNGVRGEEWYALPSNETVQATWPLGESLFPEPRDYVLTLEFQGRTVATHTVSVAP